MTVKFIQYFDILSGKEDEFNHFVLKNYIPGINETGLMEVANSWRVASGEGPFRIFESVAESLNDVNRVLQMDHIKKLNHLFHFLITSYKSKIIAPAGHIEPEVPTGTHFRFNHHYDINYDRVEEYAAFMKDEHVPTMERLGIRMIGGWYVAIGPGPNISVEGAASNIQEILDAIGSKEYQFLTDRLLTMVTTFGSKILSPTSLVQ